MKGSAHFWLATFDGAADGNNLDPMAIEVVAVRHDDGQSDVAVMISAIDNIDHPRKMSSRTAYSNCIHWANALREQGFYTLDAWIPLKRDRRIMPIKVPHFPARTLAEQVTTLNDHPLLTLDFGADSRGPDTAYSLGGNYAQAKIAPSVALPATEFATLNIEAKIRRSSVRQVPVRDAALIALEVALPKPPIPTGQLMRMHKVWCGDIQGWPLEANAPSPSPRPSSGKQPVGSSPPKPVQPAVLHRRLRGEEFGPQCYRFEGVEGIGFRVDLSALNYDADVHLRELLEPLNFHLAEGHTTGVGGIGTTAFEYRAASRVIVFELLRYGRMMFPADAGLLEPGAYVSQHELAVRLLVGRVDDDTAQARDPAIFVPAIFVDNAWSKLMGREVQGFAKELADFCVEGGVPLTSDGLLRDATLEKRPLNEVCELRLVSSMNRAPSSADTLLRIALPQDNEPSSASFSAVDLRSQLGADLFNGRRWRQNDFEEAEFRRSFASAVMDDELNRFRSIQVSPVDRRGLPQAWIRGDFELNDLAACYPSGVATLTLCDPAAAPGPWKTLCRMLGTQPLSLTTGDWYRMKFSMDLSINDGLQ